MAGPTESPKGAHRRELERPAAVSHEAGSAAGTAPNVTGIPGVPRLPDVPGVPGLSGGPNVPRVQGLPDVQGVPGVPRLPDVRHVPNVPSLPSLRSVAKANRRQAMLDAAAQLFAQHGYNRVSIEDLGAAAGVSGPAVYRHFSGKQAVLAALLVGVSEDLFTGGTSVVAHARDDDAALRGLIRFHVDFALSNPDVIRVQDRDLTNLAPADQKSVRTLQRHYIDQWVAVLGRLQPGVTEATLRLKVQATFGLINSTPHSARSPGRNVDARTARPVLEAMARAGLLA